MSILGCVVKPGQKGKVAATEGQVWHLTQACLHEAKAGKSFVQAHVKGETYAVACLEKGAREHIALDLFFDQQVEFSASGSSELHLLGCLEPKEDVGEDEEVEGEESEEEGEESEEEEPEKEKAAALEAKRRAEAPAALAPPAKKAKKAAAAAPKASSPPKSEAAAPAEKAKEAAAAAPKEAAPPKPEVAAPKASASPKAAPAAKASPAAKPVTSPAAKPEATPDELKYVEGIVEFLKKSGKCTLSKLGGEVKRPAGVPKMKFIFERHEDKFVLTGEEVDLKK